MHFKRCELPGPLSHRFKGGIFLLKFNLINQNKLWTIENKIIKMQVLSEPENANLVKFILIMNLLERKFMEV